LSDCFLLRRVHHFVRSALGHDTSRVEHDHALAQRKDFLAAVRDVKDGNAVSLIPLAQVVNDFGLGWGVQRGQGFVQKQHHWIGHQGSG